MADSLRWGILATGSIARQFAGGLRVSRRGRLVAVGSRNLETAEKFCGEYGGRAYGSYEEVLADPEVDAVYIATPHHLHMANTIAAARAGKAILCEKPFTLNLKEAELALAAVREAGVFFMEAFMYRCHPQTRRLVELLGEDAIGRILQVNAEFGFAAGRDWTNFRADGAVGGGGLMDVGTYCVSFSRLVAGAEPSAAHYVAEITERGYDASGAGVLKFPNDVVAHFGTGIHVNLRNDATIYGEKGRIHIANPWKCASGGITLERNGESELMPFGSTNDELYAFEADAVAEFFESGECPTMTKADTFGNVRALDMLRDSAGLSFAAETR